MEQKELFEQAKGAKSAEELVSLAKENGMELTEEEAAAYQERRAVRRGAGQRSGRRLP